MFLQSDIEYYKHVNLTSTLCKAEPNDVIKTWEKIIIEINMSKATQVKQLAEKIE